MATPEIFMEKTFSILGDSVSTLFGCSRPQGAEYYTAYRGYGSGVYYFSDTWWGQLIDAAGGRLLVNDSFSGSTVSSIFPDDDISCASGDRRTSSLGENGEAPDVILIFMGINDRGYGVKLEPTSDAEKGSPAVFSEAYRLMLDKIRSNYPRAKVFCMTLPLPERDGYPPTSNAKRISGEYSRVIAECAAEKGCGVIDISNMEPYTTVDGLHPNACGMKMIAKAVLDAFEGSL